ncbi:MAG: hypothetical protein LBT69_00130 [Lactobacillales bacterium]|jgi:K+ transporter|nr:hypothetical protein [Lactobacillales bacterium]
MNNEQKIFWKNLSLFFLFLLGGFCLLSILEHPIASSNILVKLISGAFFLLMAGFFSTSFYFAWQIYQKRFAISINRGKIRIEKSLDEIQKIREKNYEIEKNKVTARECVDDSKDKNAVKSINRAKVNTRKYRAKNH